MLYSELLPMNTATHELCSLQDLMRHLALSIPTGPFELFMYGNSVRLLPGSEVAIASPLVALYIIAQRHELVLLHRAAAMTATGAAAREATTRRRRCRRGRW